MFEWAKSNHIRNNNTRRKACSYDSDISHVFDANIRNSKYNKVHNIECKILEKNKFSVGRI